MVANAFRKWATLCLFFKHRLAWRDLTVLLQRGELRLRNSHPLCVDLDGTLVKTDTLVESLLLLVKKNPAYLFLIPLWLCQGKAFLKYKISLIVELNPALLPYQQDFLKFLRQEHSHGRKLVLATAANEKIANGVAEYLGIFSEIHASNDKINLSGSTKAQHLRQNAGDDGYAYAGNAMVDLPIWQGAKEAIVANAAPKVLRKARESSAIVKTFGSRQVHIQDYLRAIRVYQWVKNLLIFLPILLAHQWANLGLLANAALAFLAYCLCASSVYLVNDLIDLESDRQHSEKCRRPFASGELPLHMGILGVPIFLLSGLILSAIVSWQLCLILVGYYILMTCANF